MGIWRDRCGSQLSALIELYGSKLFISHMSAQNEISGTGKMMMSVTSGEGGRYWAGKNATLSLMENWGVVDGPIVTTLDWIKKIAFPLMNLESDDLKPVFMSLSASIKLNKELDGRTYDFGERFIDWTKNELQILSEKFVSNNVLEKLTYSDRYLRSPVHIVLLRSLFKSILNVCGNENTEVSVLTTDMPPSERKPYRIFHNFVDGIDRDNVLNGVLSSISANSSIEVAGHSSETSHARTLTLRFNDGDEFEVDFDQGMGAWRYLGNGSWDSYAETVVKVDNIVNDMGSVCISGKWGTLINLRKNN